MIDPRFMELQEWADFMVHDLRQYGEVPILSPGQDWHDWAQLLIELPAIARKRPPQPQGFSDWRDWVFHFNQVVRS